MMVLVGGLTRLTDSGLSITEWQPISGALPPLSAVDWEIAFAKYREIPEYQLINAGMSLEAFKVIYWWGNGVTASWGVWSGWCFSCHLSFFCCSAKFPNARLARFWLCLRWEVCKGLWAGTWFKADFPIGSMSASIALPCTLGWP